MTRLNVGRFYILLFILFIFILALTSMKDVYNLRRSCSDMGNDIPNDIVIQTIDDGSPMRMMDIEISNIQETNQDSLEGVDTDLNIYNLTADLSGVLLPQQPITIAQLVTEEKNHKYINQSIVTMKSVLLFTKESIRYLLFSHDNGPQMILHEVKKWPKHIQERIYIEVINVSLDSLNGLTGIGANITMSDIIGLGKIQKIQYLLQLMYLTSQVRNVIVLDADTMFLSDVLATWNLFKYFNDSQFAGFGPGGGRYHMKGAEVYGNAGFNSGVILLDLEKIRKHLLLAEIMIQRMLNKTCFPYDDQCAMMAYFAKHPETVYAMTCSYNLHVGIDPCIGSSSRRFCESVFHQGIYILHGSGSYFIKHNESEHNILLHAIREYQFPVYKNKNGLTTPYWKNVLDRFGKQRRDCGDASLKSLEYFMRRTNLIT